MNLILLLLASFTFASELEVQGNLKVTGNIDAQNNPITNVGAPQAMTDAVNAQTLNNILTDDTEYEYKVYITKIGYGTDMNVRYIYRNEGSSTDWLSYFVQNVLLDLLDNGWKIDNTINYGAIGEGAAYTGSGGKVLYIFKRPIQGDE